jgi:predicted O-methyltransferase YrrM
MSEEKIIPEVCIATSVCPEPWRWTCYDDMATEIEVLDFLYALVVMLKPKVVIETGCYHGHGTEQLLWGIVDNKLGELYTCDVGWESIKITSERILDKLGEQTYTLLQCSGLDLITQVPAPIDLAFLDSGPDEIRTNELRALYPKLAPGGVVAIHDTGVHGFLREKYLAPVVAELDLQAICFDTPRGLTLVRKRPTIYPI